MSYYFSKTCSTMLPCNVIVAEVVPGTVEIAAVDPIALMARC